MYIVHGHVPSSRPGFDGWEWLETKTNSIAEAIQILVDKKVTCFLIFHTSTQEWCIESQNCKCVDHEFGYYACFDQHAGHINYADNKVIYATCPTDAKEAASNVIAGAETYYNVEGPFDTYEKAEQKLV